MSLAAERWGSNTTRNQPMRKTILTVAGAICLAGAASTAPAQAPPNPGGAGGSPLVARMMAFDKNKDGKLTRDEITDERLLRLFDQADTNKDGVVTKEELIAL